MSARQRILARLRAVRSPGNGPAITARIAAHPRGPAPAAGGDRVGRFRERAQRLASTVAQVARRDEVPAEVSRYLAEAGLLPRLVCWPELRDLDWAGAGAHALFRPAGPSDPVGVTGAFAGIAETGSLMVISGVTTHATTSLLPETHIAVLPASAIVDTMEDAFDRLRREARAWPRAVNVISGPSRTADIEQTVTLGAHGPYRVHIIIVEQA